MGPLCYIEQANLPVVDTIHSKGNKIVTGAKALEWLEKTCVQPCLIQMISYQQMQKFNESLMATLLYLLGSPGTRPYVRADVGLEVYYVAYWNCVIYNFM